MELHPQHGPQPAAKPSGPKVTHFTFPLTPNTEMRDENEHTLLSGSVICNSAILGY